MLLNYHYIDNTVVSYIVLIIIFLNVYLTILFNDVIST